MKKIMLTLACMLLSAFAFAQQANGPILSLESNILDLGVIEEQGEISREVTFTNLGNGSLILKLVKASCGCTTSNWSREFIHPGQSSSLTINYDTNGRLGPIYKTVDIISNSIDGAQTITITGEVKPRGSLQSENYQMGNSSYPTDRP